MWRTERITGDHFLDPFVCGNETLDVWLRQSALTADRMGNARTYLWVDEKQEVLAYFATVPWVVVREDLPRSIGSGAPDRVSGILNAKLALHERLRGQPERFGSILIADALRLALDTIRIGGGRVILVDAIDENARASMSITGSAAPRTTAIGCS
jgi:hypothetical protein